MSAPLTLEKLTEIFLFTKAVTSDIAWIEKEGIENMPTEKLKEVLERTAGGMFPPLKCAIVVINRGERELETPRQFEEYFKDTPGFKMPEVSVLDMDYCLCHLDRGNIECLRSGVPLS